MQNVAPSRALVRRARSLLQLAFVMASAAIFLIVLGIALFVVPGEGGLAELLASLLLLLGVISGLGAIGVAIRAVTLRTENDLARLVGNALATSFDERFTFIRNVSKRQLGYIDAVLVGPPGVLVFRIIDMTGVFLNEGDKWLKRSPQGTWDLLGRNPSQNVIQDVTALREYLSKKELGATPVYGVVVLTREPPACQLEVKQPAVPATHLSSLYVRLGSSYLAKDRIDPATVRKLVSLLYDR